MSDVVVMLVWIRRLQPVGAGARFRALAGTLLAIAHRDAVRLSDTDAYNEDLVSSTVLAWT